MSPDPAVAPGARRIDGSLAFALAAAAVAGAAVATAVHSLPSGQGGGEQTLAGWLAAVAALLAIAVGMMARALLRRRRANAEDAFLARVAVRLQAEHGLARTLCAALRELSQQFGARQATLVARESESGRAVAWGGPGGSSDPHQELAAEVSAEWLFEASARAWDAQRRRDGRWRVAAIDEAGSSLEARAAVPTAGIDRIAARLAARRVVAVDFGQGSTWSGRLVLADPTLPGPRLESLRFLQRLVRELGGIVQARYLLGRVRARVGALERARIARDLHDGTIQSLVGVSMELEVLRRRAEQRGSPMAGEVRRVQALLQAEILDLRDTMQRLKPIEVQPAQLVGFLDSALARFERDSGIQSLFDCGIEDVDLSPRVCREVARIVLEALHNVRKHSDARHLVVRFGPADGGGYRLVVDDDGKGFPFVGELSHEQLDHGRKGPFVIRERVRALGGELAIASSSGGARLEIRVPREQT